MVQKLMDGIQVQNNLIITLTKTKVKDDKLENWIGDLSYMETKVTEAFGVVKGNKNQGRGGNGRSISAVNGCGQGRVGRGKGRGRVRGQGCGCSNITFFNGVDCQYFKKRF